MIDLVDSVQQLVRGVGPNARKVGIVSEDAERRWKRQHFEGAELQRFLASGRAQAARMEQRIESETGATLKGRRVLDFGCGTGRMALAIAEGAERVYGLDVMQGALDKAKETGKEANVTNVEWLDASKLHDLAGAYDGVICYQVFNHIPSRQGERVFSSILSGLRDGGVGAVHFTVRPPKLLAGLRIASASAGRGLRRKHRAVTRYGYLVMNSYSLNRLGAILNEQGVSRWHVRWAYHGARSSVYQYPSVVLVFRKDAIDSDNAEVAADASLEVQSVRTQLDSEH